MKILLCVPDMLRDLEGHALVAYQLQARHGHDVKLIDPASVRYGFFEHAPDAIVLDYVGSHERRAAAEAARRFRVPVIMLPTAVFFQDKDRVWQRVVKVMQSNRTVDYYLACGEEDRQNVLEAKLLAEDSIYVVGCPRFDFYAEPYLRLMEERQVLLGRFGVRSPAGPVVLWVTNTTLGHGVQRGRVMGHVRYGGWSKRELEDEIADHETQYREHSAAILDLARRHPGWTFLVKVHPSEPLEPYQSLPAAVSNIYCEKSVPIRCALYHADVVVQRGCTTASESWMLGKPVVELDIGHYRQAIRADFRAGNEPAREIDQLDRIVERYLAGAPIPPDQQRAREGFIRDVYIDVSGKAAERCADAIDAIIRGEGLSDAARQQRSDRIREENQSYKRRSDNRVVNRLKDLLGLDRDRSLRLWRGYVRASWQRPKRTLEIDATELYRRFGEAIGAGGDVAKDRFEAHRRESS